MGSEFVLACDMRFAARESAILGQFEPAFGVIPGAGAAQHLTRLMGRGRALEVLLSADDYDAEIAGSIERCPPANSTISSKGSRFGLAVFPPLATPWSRIESTQSRSLRPRTFVVIPISSSRA